MKKSTLSPVLQIRVKDATELAQLGDQLGPLGAKLVPLFEQRGLKTPGGIQLTLCEKELAELTDGTSSFGLVKKAGRPRTHHNIVRPPGSLLSSAADFFFSPKTLELVVRPIISDLQMEYCEALAAGRRYKAACVRLRGYWSLFKAVGLYSLTKTLVEMWRKVSSV